MSGLEGKVALVTGGSRGIGAAIGRRLAAEGADVSLTYLHAADAAQKVVDDVTALGRRGFAMRADSASADEVVTAVDETVTRFGRLDILVNNAGIFPNGPLDAITVDDIDRTLAIHVRAALLASQAAARHMTTGSRIINIGSNISDQVPFPGVTLYAASKAALIGLTKGLARDLGPRGITANLVQPGSTDTDMNPVNGESADHQRSLTILDRFGTPEDIAAAVAYLAADSGRNVTGSTLTVDAGTNV